MNTFPDFQVSVVELDLLSNRNDALMIQSYLSELTYQHTVPNIFIGSRHFGGNSDIQALDHAGTLVESIVDLVVEQKRSLEL